MTYKKTDTLADTRDSKIKNSEILQKLVNQLINTLSLEEITLPTNTVRTFIGQSFDYVGKRVFGGQVLGQALMAASHTIDESKPCHSLHGYFLRGGDINLPIMYQVESLRDGKSLSARRVTAIQYKQSPSNEPLEQIIFSMIASYAPMEVGLEYQPDMPIYPPAEDLLTEQELKEKCVHQVPEKLKSRFMRQRHIEIRPINPRDPINPTPMQPQQASWLRIPLLDNQSVAMQQALLAFSSDFYLVGTGLMPHGINFMTKGLQAASIDHSMHFHRPFDLNEWLLYDMWSDNTSHAKNLNHGQFWQNGQLIASVRQEGLMRLRKG